MRLMTQYAPSIPSVRPLPKILMRLSVSGNQISKAGFSASLITGSNKKPATDFSGRAKSREETPKEGTERHCPDMLLILSDLRYRNGYFSASSIMSSQHALFCE